MTQDAGERVHNAVKEQGGEILKFMGDGAMFVFPLEGRGVQQACRNATQSIEKLSERIKELNREGSAPVELHFGAGLHVGEVLYGNIGARTRLDFTVMGRAVNLVARLQNVTGDLGENVLFSAAVAEHLDEPIESIGEYSFKGVEQTVEVFRVAPKDERPPKKKYRRKEL